MRRVCGGDMFEQIWRFLMLVCLLTMIGYCIYLFGGSVSMFV